jgi:type VI secretion system protein ImpJ
VYLTLIQVAGQLCTFSVSADPSTLPSFQFTNMRATFEELFRRITDLMRSVALEQCLTVDLSVGTDGMFRGRLEDERLERCGQFLLAVRSELAAAPGVPLAVTYRPPPEVPVQPGTVYFSLSLNDGYWKNVMRDRNLALYLPQPFDASRTSVELLAVPTANR